MHLRLRPNVEIVIATDGVRDYVMLPEGDSYNLGSVSVLRLVAELAESNSAARRTLDTFLANNSAKLAVNLDALRTLLAPKRARWAAGDSSIADYNRNLSARGPMDPKIKFAETLTACEKTLEYLWGAKQAGNEAAVASASEALGRRIAALKTAASAVQSEQDEQGEKKEAGEMPDFIKDKIEDKKDDEDKGQKEAGEMPSFIKDKIEEKDEDKKDEKKASFDVLEENSKLAEEILTTVNAADDGVDEAVADGKPVNASKAKGDLFKVASRLANVLQDADLAQPWVRDELMALHSSATTIASYFPVTAASKDWTEKGGKWMQNVQYAGGEKHSWTISEAGDKFEASVKTPKGSHKAKKKFDSLEAAQKFGDRFIQKANGNEMLEKALDKDFS